MEDKEEEEKEEEEKEEEKEEYVAPFEEYLTPCEEKYDILKIGHIQLSSKHYNVYQLANLLLNLLEQKNIQGVIETIKKTSGSTGYLG